MHYLRLFLVASDEYREGQRRQRDGGDEDVDYGRRDSGHSYGFQEGLHVGDEDDPGDRRAQNAGGQEPHYVCCEGSRDDAADQEGAHYAPRDFREAQGDQEADARSDGYQELASIHGADHLTRLHPARREQRGGVDGPPTTAARRVQEPGPEAEWGEQLAGDGLDHDGTVVPPEREARQDVDAQQEEEQRHKRCRRLRRDIANREGARKGAKRAWDRHPPQLAPVHVAEPPVGQARGRRGGHLRYVDARGG